MRPNSSHSAVTAGESTRHRQSGAQRTRMGDVLEIIRGLTRWRRRVGGSSGARHILLHRQQCGPTLRRWGMGAGCRQRGLDMAGQGQAGYLPAGTAAPQCNSLLQQALPARAGLLEGLLFAAPTTELCSSPHTCWPSGRSQVCSMRRHFLIWPSKARLLQTCTETNGWLYHIGACCWKQSNAHTLARSAGES